MNHSANFPGNESLTDRPPPTVYVHNCFGKGGTRCFARFLAGAEGDKSAYGFHLASDLGYRVVLSEDSETKGKQIARRIFNRIFGFDVVHAYRNRKRIAAADVIWTMTEGEAFAIALLFQLRLLRRKPIITSTVWIINAWGNTPAWRKAIYTRLARSLTAITVQSEKCLPVAKAIFPHVPVELMYFGINMDLFRLTPPEDKSTDRIRIFAAGTDRTREWDTLVSAFGNDDRFELVIYCSWFPSHRTALYRNLTVFSALTIPAFLDQIRQATIVAVPMKENIFSGITFALDATALGKPVLCSRTGGVPTYFDEGELFYTPVGDAAAMRELVVASTPETRTERAQAAQRRFIERDYSTRAMMARYAELTQQFAGIGVRRSASEGRGHLSPMS